MHSVRHLVSPKYCYQFAEQCVPFLCIISFFLFLYGTVGGLYLSPPDYQQGDGFRIIYVHVPAAFLSLSIYTIIFINSVFFLIWRLKIADVIAEASAAIGAIYTMIALITGAIWGKPMWGTWWIWDARLTSELILLFLYMGYMGLRSAITEQTRAAKSCAILAVIGMVDIPIIHFSVEWWATLHQGPTLAKFAKPSIDTTMLYPLLAMIAGFACFYGLILALKVRLIILKRELRTDWVQTLILKGKSV